jgi:hypothetical protein
MIEPEIIERYQSGASLEELSLELGISVASLRSRLVKAKVYTAKKYTPKYASKPYTKEELVQLVEAACNKQAGEFEGLENCPKRVLLDLCKALNVNIE